MKFNFYVFAYHTAFLINSFYLISSEDLNNNTVRVSPCTNPEFLKIIRQALLNDNFQDIEELLKRGFHVNSTLDKQNNTLMHKTIYNNAFNILQFLIDLQNTTSSHVQSQSTQQNVVNINQQNTNGWTPAHIAMINNKKPALQILLQAQADFNIPDKDGYSALHTGVLNTPYNTLKFVIENAVKTTYSKDENGILQKQTSSLLKFDTKASNGWTLLHTAYFLERKKTIQLLKRSLEQSDVEIIQNNCGLLPHEIKPARHLLENEPAHTHTLKPNNLIRGRYNN